MKTPCDIICNIITLIKKEFTYYLENDLRLSLKEISIKLDTAETAILRYHSGKRRALKIMEEEIYNKIKNSAEKILKNNGRTVIIEICRICKLLKSKQFVEDINYACE